MNTNKYDVFISSKSEDYPLANQIYEFLVNHGINVFFADVRLKELGAAEYSEAIDNAIDNSRHMIVVGSTRENIESKWVKTEWRSFSNELRAERKSGNLITVLHGISPSDLPLTLRNVQSFTFDNYQNDILGYLGDVGTIHKVKKNKVDNIKALFNNKHSYLLFIASALISLFVTLILSNCIVSDRDVYNYLESSYIKDKTTALNNIDGKIKIIAGQMDSAYHVAVRLSKDLEDEPIASLEEMEYGTLEYNGDNKAKYTIAKYPLEVNETLRDYVQCMIIYNDDFELLDSLSAEYNKIEKRQFDPHQCSDNEYSIARFGIIIGNVWFSIFIGLIYLLCFSITIMSLALSTRFKIK